VLPLDREKLARDPARLIGFLRERGVGLVHAHAVTEAPRGRAEWAAHALGVPKIVTLHDVLFLRRDSFDRGGAPVPDEAWLAQTAPFIRSAAAVIAPSEYLAGIVRGNLPGVSVEVVPNGSGVRFDAGDVPVHRDYRGREFRHAAIVLGAVGPHKGSRCLEDTAARLAGTDIGIVVIGYMDAANLPAWHRDRLFVHGSYQDAEVASLIRAYGGEVGLFTNQVPESFSYALSDLWAAGLPGIVPPTGALGERVRAHGGGWILGEGFTGEEVASLLKRLFSAEGSAELARVKSQLHGNDDDRVPALDAMTRKLDALYERFGIDAAAPIDAQSADVQELLATSLDGSLFRAEMVRFADEIDQLRRGLDHERSEYARGRDEMKQWIGKLEADVATLQAQLAAQAQARAAEHAESRKALDALRAQYENIPRVVRRLFRKKTDASG
jgi:glycosyltransferase involved in cell wall biosynthesis